MNVQSQIFMAFSLLSWIWIAPISGCAWLTGIPPLPQEQFSLTVPQPSQVSSLPPIEVQLLEAQQPFDQTEFLLRTATHQWERDWYGKFVASPEELVTNQLRLRFSNANKNPRTPIRLEGKIIELYGDFRDAHHPRAVITAQFSLRKTNLPANEAILKQWNYSVSRPLSSPTRTSLVQAWNEGLEEIFNLLEKEIHNTLAQKSWKDAL